MNTILRHLRGNLVAYLALLIALGGTSYAAVSLPKNSVGAKQIKTSAVRTAEIKNGSITASDLKAGLLPTSSAQPFVRVYMVASHSLAVGDPYRIPFDSESEDSFAMHDSAQPTRLVAPQAGLYAVSAVVNWGNDADGQRYLEIEKNGTVNNSVVSSVIQATTSLPTVQNVSGVVRLNAGEFVTVRVTHYNTGNNISVTGDAVPITYATMTYLGE